jgi:signal transduction histidine kinase
MTHSPSRSSSHAPKPLSPAEHVAFLSRLAGGLAHEIKNPLSTIAINLALLEEEWGKAAAGRNPAAPELTPREQRSLRRLKTLQREVGRLEHIVEEFLNFARGAQINRAPHDLATLMRDVLEFVEPEDAALGIRHHAELPVGVPLVMLDEPAFKQAVINLLKNAREAMPSGGELLVRLRRDGNWAELTITDTGVGMSAESVERCFDEYWSDKKGGTGLGLPTTRRIVEEHGGTLSVVSERGRGTSFTIYLPLIVEIARNQDATAAAEGTQA